MVLIVVKSRWKWLKVCGWPSSPTTVAADVNTPPRAAAERRHQGDGFEAVEDADGSKGIVRCVQERSLARQRRWPFKAQPVARQCSVSFRTTLTFAANDDQSQV